MATKKATTKNLNELKKLWDNLDTPNSQLALKLLNEAVFMEATLKELKKETEAKGVITSMCQGKYNIERANPALQAYNVTIKNYNTTIKQLNEMLPKDLNPKDDGFDNF